MMLDRSARLAVFPEPFVGVIREKLGLRGDERLREPDWPALVGCVVVLFTSRSGSTFLCQHAHGAFRVPPVGEWLNAPRLVARGQRQGHASSGDTLRSLLDGAQDEAGWFMCKAGGPGVVSGELHGFFDRYLDRMGFALLLRRDLVAQAVSVFKAGITQQYHSTHEAKREAREEEFDAGAVARIAGTLLKGSRRLLAFAEATGRPLRPLAYEDFEGGRWDEVDAALSALGLPRREGPGKVPRRAVAKLDRGVNAVWRDRFMDGLDGEAAETLAAYDAQVAQLLPGRA